jgi:hypothetical protein
MIIVTKASKEQLQARLDLRRSNAAQPHKSKRAYNRKDKSWRKGDD